MNNASELEGDSAALAVFYKDLLHPIGDGVYFVDRDRKIQFWNKAAEAHTGYTESDVLGRCCSDALLYRSKVAGRNRATME